MRAAGQGMVFGGVRVALQRVQSTQAKKRRAVQVDPGRHAVDFEHTIGRERTCRARRSVVVPERAHAPRDVPHLLK